MCDQRQVKLPKSTIANVKIFNAKSLPAVAGIALMSLGACAKAPAPSGYDDPHEVKNRRTHAANVDLDKIFVSPASNAYGEVLPRPARDAVELFSDNAGLPGVVANNINTIDLSINIK